MKQYSVKEIYYTLQGEGAHTGRPAVFLRFAGCNLWTGKEEDRKIATCTFCDTDFVGTNGPNGGKYNSVELAKKVRSLWPGGERPYVVCTGGEPLLQLDESLIDVLHGEGFEVGVETNGTQEQPEGLDWVCVSPKPNTEIKITSGNELKLVFPQSELPPEKVSHFVFEHYFLQPMDGPQKAQNTEKTVAYCLKNPKWKLSLQTHKLIGIP